MPRKFLGFAEFACLSILRVVLLEDHTNVNVISLCISPLLQPYIAQAQDRGVCHIAAASRLRDPVEIFDRPFSSSADLGKGRSGGSDKRKRHATLWGHPSHPIWIPAAARENLGVTHHRSNHHTHFQERWSDFPFRLSAKLCAGHFGSSPRHCRCSERWLISAISMPKRRCF